MPMAGTLRHNRNSHCGCHGGYFIKLISDLWFRVILIVIEIKVMLLFMRVLEFRLCACLLTNKIFI